MREKAIAPKTSKEIKKAFDIDEKKCSNLFRQREKYSQLPLFSSGFTKFQKNIKDKITYVTTLLFWMGGFSFERTAPLLPVFPEISRFTMRWLMILAGMSDIYEFSKLITFFTNLMSKSWLIITKLGVWVPIHHLHHQLQIRFNKSFIVLAFSKKSSISSGAQVWKSMQFLIFKPWKLLWNRSIKQINYQKLLKFLLFGSV